MGGSGREGSWKEGEGFENVLDRWRADKKEIPQIPTFGYSLALHTIEVLPSGFLERGKITDSQITVTGHRNVNARLLTCRPHLPELLLWNGARRGEAEWSQVFVSPRGPNATCDAMAL